VYGIVGVNIKLVVVVIGDDPVFVHTKLIL
jgi:hypothetical protein